MRLHPTIVLDTQTIPTTANTDFVDYTGGGRSSGRETIGRVAAGAVAAKLLQELGITVTAYTRSIGPVQINESRFDLSEMERNAVNMPDAEAAEQAMAYLDACRTKRRFLRRCGGMWSRAYLQVWAIPALIN